MRDLGKLMTHFKDLFPLTMYADFAMYVKHAHTYVSPMLMSNALNGGLNPRTSLLKAKANVFAWAITTIR